jgi:2-keto-4-pentenoate hydratase/2-oxohepta-3-ene-1,7-dioic acid hydratase in catechol pathway
MYELDREQSSVVVRTPDGVLRLGPVLGIGRNYAAHAAEQGLAAPERPMVFSKNPASLCLHDEPILIPPIARDPATGGPEQVDYEGELAVVLGQAIRDADAQAALAAVLGYTIANDVSARWWQKQGGGGQFWRGKSFDTFCPIGPVVVPAVQIPDPERLRLTTRLNGEIVQDAPTSDMTFPVGQLLAELSRSTTLTPGTVILTGTPSGVGMSRNPPRYLRHGDTVSITIEPIGTLTNPVQDA